jgi:hypothetical protein
MADTVVSKPTKEQVLDAREKIVAFFQEDFKNKVKSHLEDNHTYMFGKSLWRLTETHPEIIKDYGIYVLLGTNRRHEDWGNLKEEFDVEPARYELTQILVGMAREVAPSYYHKVIFTDKPKSDGNFKLRVEFSKLVKKSKETESTDSEGFKPVKKGVRTVSGTTKTDTLDALKKELAREKARVQSLQLTLEKSKKN